MAWTGKVEAKDLIGLSREELEAKLTDINNKIAKVETLEASNTTLSSEVQNIKNSLAALEGKVVTPTTAPVVDTNQPKYDWSEDADNAFNYRAAPLVQKTMNIEAEIMFQKVLKKLGAENPIFFKLENEAQVLLAKEPLQHRGIEKVIEYAFKIAYAENAAQIQKDQNAKSGKFFTETGENQTSTTVSNDPVKGLSEAEKRQAEKFGMTPEKYAESKATMNFVR